MKTKSLITGILLATAALVRAATNELTTALQRGLFEEEANHNLEAAAQAYQAVSARFDQDRKLAATGIFRLGEVYRKQGKTNEAAAQYERIVREFSDQQTLVTLSRQNLGGLGISADHKADTQDEVQRQYLEQQATVSELEALVTQLKKLDRHELRRVLPKVSPDPLLSSLLDEMSGAQKAYASLLQNQGEAGPLAREQGAKLNQLDKQVEERMDGVVAGLERRLAAAKSLLGRLEDRVRQGRSVGGAEPASKAARLEQKRLLEEEIDLVGKKLESQRRIIPSGRVSQADILTTQQELLALKRQLVAVSDNLSAASNTAASNPDAKAVPDDEEKEIGRIQALIQNSPDLLNAAGEGSLTPLCRAAGAGWLRVAKFLLDNGAAIDGRARNWTPLHFAASSGHKAMVELLAERGADINARDNNGETALHLAAASGYLSVAEALIQRKADVNARSKKENEGVIPLHRAATQGRPEMVAFLASKGAEVDARDAAGMTALSRAAMHGHTEVLNKLLGAGAKPDIEDEPLTALGYAAMRGHLDSVKTLLAAKADPNAGKSGPPLWWAISRPECVKLLLEAGAKPNVKKEDGQTPLVTAVEKGHYESAVLLVQHDADVNVANNKRMTPLQMAVWAESIPMVSLLLTNHAEVNAQGPVGRNALIMAKEAMNGFRPSKPGDYGGSGREPNKLIAGKIADLLRQHGAQDQVADKP